MVQSKTKERQQMAIVARSVLLNYSYLQILFRYEADWQAQNTLKG